MRILFLHVDYLEYEVKEKALKSAPDVPASQRRGRVEEALVCFISAEKRDEANLAGVAKAADDKYPVMPRQWRPLPYPPGEGKGGGIVGGSIQPM